MLILSQKGAFDRTCNVLRSVLDIFAPDQKNEFCESLFLCLTKALFLFK